jgi:hypothetical protein
VPHLWTFTFAVPSAKSAQISAWLILFLQVYATFLFVWLVLETGYVYIAQAGLELSLNAPASASKVLSNAYF